MSRSTVSQDTTGAVRAGDESSSCARTTLSGGAVAMIASMTTASACVRPAKGQRAPQRGGGLNLDVFGAGCPMPRPGIDLGVDDPPAHLLPTPAELRGYRRSRARHRRVGLPMLLDRPRRQSLHLGLILGMVLSSLTRNEAASNPRRSIALGSEARFVACRSTLRFGMHSSSCRLGSGRTGGRSRLAGEPTMSPNSSRWGILSRMVDVSHERRRRLMLTFFGRRSLRAARRLAIKGPVTS
jgi:hypothetical protein